MTTAISIRFPFGRYHATAWRRTANEGVVEWPPSPWRVLRALYSTWKSRLPRIQEEIVHGILSSLADPPSFWLPGHTEAHTRHYMPDIAKGTDKILDAFAVINPDSPVVIRWPKSLEPSWREVLADLCSAVPYLGRAESICDICLLNNTDQWDESRWVFPEARSVISEAPTRVLVPESPIDLLALVVRTSEVRKQGKVVPPGTKWVTYPSVPPMPRPRRVPVAISQPRCTAVLLRFDAPALPSYFETVAYGEALRRAVMSIGNDSTAARFSGKDGNGGWRRDGHNHPHFLALDLDGDRLIESAIVWAKEGLDAYQLTALFNLRKLDSQAFRRRYRNFRALRVVAEAVGDPGELVPELCRSSRTWTSVTPFAPYRHQKKYQSATDFLKVEIDRELQARGMDVTVEHVERVVGSQPWLSFRRNRLNQDAYPAFGVRIVLDRDVTGPLVLGALSHFGLGIFCPDR